MISLLEALFSFFSFHKEWRMQSWQECLLSMVYIRQLFHCSYMQFSAPRDNCPLVLWPLRHSFSVPHAKGMATQKVVLNTSNFV